MAWQADIPEVGGLVRFHEPLAMHKISSSARWDASAGTAGATAMANMPQPMDRGASMVSGGVGHHRGETAFAIGFSSAFESGLIVKAGASVDTRGAGIFGAGAGFQF